MLSSWLAKVLFPVLFALMTSRRWRLVRASVLILLCLPFGITASAHESAANDASIVVKGTIGGSPVVMTFGPDDNGNEVSGTYFYQKYKHDITLHGTVRGNEYRLTEGPDFDEDRTVNHMVVHRDGTQLTGIYTTAQGKALPIALELIPPGSIPEPRPDLKLEADERDRLNTDGDYNRLRLTGISLVPQKQEIVGGHFTIRWYLEPHSGERIFRLVAGWPATVMAAINTQLETRQFTSAAADLACAGDGATPEVISFTLVNDRFLSFQASSSWDCEGAAHPDSAIDGITFDTRTGKQLVLEDILWLGQGDKPKDGSDAWIRYRSKTFAPAVMKLLTRLHPDQMQTPSNQDGCNYADTDVWSIIEYWLTNEGLRLVPSFSHVESPCNDADWAVIPYSVLAKDNPALFGQ